MSKERMQDLLIALREAGWQHLEQDEYPRGTEALFALDNDAIKWGLAPTDRSRLLELEFHAFGDLGQRTENLKDIYYCIEPKSGLRLYFAKRGSTEWPESIAAFVASLGPPS